MAICKDILLGVEGLSIVDIERKRALLAGVDLDVRRGEKVGLLGPSGAGKSLLFKCVVGLVPRSLSVQGVIARFGTRFAANATWDEVRGCLRNVGFIAQDPFGAFVPEIPVGRQLQQIIVERENASARKARDRVREVLDLLAIPDPLGVLQSYADVLSGGTLQRLQAALAVLGNPRLVLADEPSASLDVLATGAVIDLLQQYCRRTNASLLVASHDVRVLATLCDRACVLVKQGTDESDSAFELLREPDGSLPDVHRYGAG